jgi:phosphohistidine phosphatase SixA
MPRILTRTLLAMVPLLTLAPTALRAQEVAPTVVYLVRHAETAPDGSQDPPLSDAGRGRAERLARMLAGTGLTAVHSTPYRRTRETAGPVAAATGLTVNDYDPSDLRAFAARLLEQGGTHLVVGHSNTTPAFVQLLGGDPAGPISEDEYGRVYVVTEGGDEVRTLITGYPGGYLADPPSARDAAPAPRPEDVESVDAIVGALYDVLSGPAGEPRDWDRLRSLFLPTARLLPVQRTPEGGVVHRALTVEDYIRSSGPIIERIGFRETEVARRIERFGDVAHVFSTYEGYQEGTEEPVLSGLNSIQLLNDGKRWWVASLAWAPARPDLPIPPRYQADGGG